MKIRDLNINDYVIVYDLGKSEYSEGMTVVGKVFARSLDYACIKTATDDIYIISDDNYFDLWSNYIESKTEHIAFDKENTKKAKKLLSNDLQQRKRKDTVNHPSHYNYGDIEVIDFIEQVTKHYNPNVAYHIGNAIKYIARAPFKNGVEDLKKAVWYLDRAIKKWEEK